MGLPAKGDVIAVAVAAGLRNGWQAGDYVVCANADIPCDGEELRAVYGERFPLRVYLQYEGIQGYGWVFPKRRHVCAGIGGRMAENRQIRPLYSKFFRELQERCHLPAHVRDEATYFDIDPVGAVYRLASLTRGRVMLIGDAAGFVSGSTGEGIYPGRVSAEVACETIHRALARGSPAELLVQFNHAWRSELADYVKRLPGGDQEGKTRRIDLIFRSVFVAGVAGRIFLYGERLTAGTLARSLWPSR